MEKKKIKIEIKNRWTGEVLFEYEKEDNTIKDTLVEAVNNGAYLGCAYLGGANLRGAYLGGAYLRGAKDVPFIPMTCPSDGAFIGWKKVYDQATYFLVKLEIPAEAKRSSSTGRKCRCDRALVLEITDLEDEGHKVESCVNVSYERTEYKVGEMVYPDSFDDDRWNECSHGIHFFINKQEAIDYDV